MVLKTHQSFSPFAEITALLFEIFPAHYLLPEKDKNHDGKAAHHHLYLTAQAAGVLEKHIYQGSKHKLHLMLLRVIHHSM